MESIILLLQEAIGSLRMTRPWWMKGTMEYEESKMHEESKYHGEIKDLFNEILLKVRIVGGMLNF